jgi:putative SOS response-associated peptidase YedK
MSTIEEVKAAERKMNEAKAALQRYGDRIELLKPYDARMMRCYPVSMRLNHVANDDEDCSQTVEIMQDEKPLLGD